MGAALAILVRDASYADSGDKVPDGSLPFARTLRTEAFNNLMYPKEEFFGLVVRIENVFFHCLNGSNCCANALMDLILCGRFALLL